MMVTVSRHETNRHNRQTSNIYKFFNTPQQFTQPQDPTDIEYTEPKQEDFPDIAEPITPAACVQEDNEALRMPLEVTVSALAVETQNYAPTVDSASNMLPKSEKSTSKITRPNMQNYRLFPYYFAF